MNYKDALELQNMFTTAAQIAKARNKNECNFQIQEDVFIEFFKKAFPTLKNNVDIAKNIYRS